MKLIDIHTHILPNVDDGSNSLEESLKHLQKMADLGVEKVFLTPHFMLGKYANNLENITQHFNAFKAEVAKLQISTEVLLGAEVYCDPTVLEQTLQERLTLGNSNYVLFETSLNDIGKDIKKFIYELQVNDFRPILAHPERYQEIKENPIKADDFLQRDVYLQINTGSILGGYGKQVQDTAFELIDRGWVHFLGSDCHCRSMVYDFPEAVDAIRHEFDNKMAELLSQTFPEKMLNNEHLPHFYMVRKETPKKKSFLEKMLDFFGE